ncbi:hypothetical protein [Segnochrobactrum spirostomi]|uniref:hypothetical protein n=1 Tax=Segnochrobactrum spirostomi TaxID=2608987 RepID=UPI001FEB97FB|nr:hypothetical protein [Segnochrobactrum spirostomi]
MISGHIEFDHTPFDPRYKYITCIREPIDRYVSWLYFMLGNPAEDPRLRAAVADFIASEGEPPPAGVPFFQSNAYVGHFSAISDRIATDDQQRLDHAVSVVQDFDVWGLYDNLDGFLVETAKLLETGSPAPLEPVNRTEQRPAVADLPPRLRSRIEEINALDIALYAALRAQRARRPGRLAALFSKGQTAPERPWPGATSRIATTPDFTLTACRLEGATSLRRGDQVRTKVDFTLRRSYAALFANVRILDDAGRCVFGLDDSERFKLEPVAGGAVSWKTSVVADLPEGSYSISLKLDVEDDGRVVPLARLHDALAFDILPAPRVRAWTGSHDLPVSMAFDQPIPHLLESERYPLSLPKRVEPGAEIQLQLPPPKGADADRSMPTMALRWVRIIDGHPHFNGMTNVAPDAVAEPITITVRAPDAIGKYRAHLAVAAGSGDPRAPDAIVIESGETHVLPKDGLRYAGGDAQCAPTQIGRRQGGTIASNGTPGFLVHGPYAALPAGIYRVVVRGSATGGTGWADACHQGGTARLGYHPFGSGGAAGSGALADFVIRSDRDIEGLEVRVWADSGARVMVSEIAIVPQTIF